MASWLGLEPKTVRLEGGSSIQLSYHDSSNNISESFIFFKWFFFVNLSLDQDFLMIECHNHIGRL